MEEQRKASEKQEKAIKAKQWRAERIAKAQDAVERSDRDPGEAVKLVTEVLDTRSFTEEREKTSATGETEESEKSTTETITIELPPLTDAEKAQLLSLRALAHNELGQNDNAIKDFQEVVKLDPGLRIPRKNLGRLLFMKREYEEALKVWKLELDDGYWESDILNLIGQSLFELYRKDKNSSRLDAARFALQMSAVQNPTDVDSRKWLAWIEYEAQRYSEAIRLLEGIRKDFPTDPEYLDLLADAYVKNDELDRALDILELSLRLATGANEKNVARQRLAYLYGEKGMPGTAADWMIRAYGDEPRRVAAADRLRIGELLARAARVEDAIRWLGSIQQAEEGYFEAQSFLATLYQDFGKVDKALEAYENVRRVRPGDGIAHLAAGDIYLDKKLYEKAFEAYSKAESCDGTKAEGLQGLAEVAYEQKNLELAARYYRKAIEESPDNQRFVVALREIEEEIRIKEEYDKLMPGPDSAAGEDEDTGTTGSATAEKSSARDLDGEPVSALEGDRIKS
jgi:tetratricopeptide (TPR) repeat protein